MPTTARRRRLSIYGGKITTYRKLAEHALAELTPFLPRMQPRVDRDAVRCPAAICPEGCLEPGSRSCTRRYPATAGRSRARPCAPPRHARDAVLDDAKTPADLGEDFGQGLTARRDRLSRATRNGRAAATTCCGGEPSAASACPTPRAHALRPTSRRQSPRVTRALDCMPLAAMPRARRAGNSRRAHRYRRHADDARPPHRRSLRGDGALARRGQARHPDHGTARGMVRSHRADVAGRRGRRRERRVLHALRRRGAQARAALRRRRADAARQPRAARGHRRQILARRARAARSPPTSATAKPTSRSISARTCRRFRARRSTGSSR